MILDRYLLKQFVPVFFVAISMFMLLVSLIDLFANLWRFLNYEVPLRDILTVSFYYLPKSFSYALPVSLLFASAYTLGDLYARNELTAVFCSGVPFWRFSLSLAALGFLVSAGAFFFEDRVVIPAFKAKNDLSKMLLHQQYTPSNSDIVIKTQSGQRVYSVDFFDDAGVTLNGVSILEKNAEGEFVSHIRSRQASWTGEYWVFSGAIIYRWENGLLRIRPLGETDAYREEPGIFRRNAVEVESLPAREAGLLVRDLKAAGLPFTAALAEYHHRFSFPAVSFVVIILSISMGGRFRKNILLMSLLASLASAAVFYVIEMISMMMARMGYIPPLAGAWFPVMIFIAGGAVLLQNART